MKKQILFVDDEQNLLDGIRRMLRNSRSQWELRFARSGQEALEILAQPPLPDLILCDIMMPGIDGFDILEELRQNPATAFIPFIFLTGKTAKSNMRQGIEIGADDYLTKPFTGSELIAAINTQLRKKADLAKYSENKLDELRQNIMCAMPHELRTPLNAIQGFSELIIDSCGTLETDEIIEMAQRIHKKSLRLHQLIENYLMYAQIEMIATDPVKIKRLQKSYVVNPSKIIREISMAKAKTAQRERDLILEIVDETVHIPEENLKKIVEELIDNAFKFSKTGTSVCVTTVVSNGAYCLCITDHGRGITPEQIAKVGAYMQFERKFYEQQGSGLGLIIAKRLAELCGGQLTIRSVLKTQTTIEVRFRRKSLG